ncbi:MAG: DNA polymerase III subunit beta [Bacteroidales bacterium]|nr:DNA polymerase III subunit beta [Bacteroidales bacterium]
MRFTATSTEFLQALLSVSKAIPQKSNIPVLENFLLELEGSNLTITASDQETTLKTIMAIENVKEGGRIAIPALLLTNSFKELPTQPVEFATNEENNLIKITWASGSANIPCLIPEDYPELPALVDPKTIEIPANVLTDAINGTIYATAEETLRPVMNGIFFDINPDSTTFVASNAHKLVCFTRKDIKGAKSSFVLPKKPANILKNNLARLSDESVNISFDKQNAFFKFDQQLVVCRLIEGTFPEYTKVIPKNNTNIITLSRTDLLNATRRVAVCANQSTGQILLNVNENTLEISAQDLDFSMSANETLSCNYQGEPMRIAFKSQFLIEILANLPYNEICIKLAEPTKAALMQPAEQTNNDEEICALLMPMRLS